MSHNIMSPWHVRPQFALENHVVGDFFLALVTCFLTGKPLLTSVDKATASTSYTWQHCYFSAASAKVLRGILNSILSVFLLHIYVTAL